MAGRVGSGQRFGGSGRVQEKWPVDNSELLYNHFLGTYLKTCIIITYSYFIFLFIDFIDHILDRLFHFEYYSIYDTVLSNIIFQN